MNDAEYSFYLLVKRTLGDRHVGRDELFMAEDWMPDQDWPELWLEPAGEPKETKDAFQRWDRDYQRRSRRDIKREVRHEEKEAEWREEVLAWRDKAAREAERVERQSVEEGSIPRSRRLDLWAEWLAHKDSGGTEVFDYEELASRPEEFNL